MNCNFVEVGNILVVEAGVLAEDRAFVVSEGRAIVVPEGRAIVEPEDRTAVVSNVFNFTFALNLHLESGHNQTMKSVVPGTGSEARRHLIAKEYVLDNIEDATVV